MRDSRLLANLTEVGYRSVMVRLPEEVKCRYASVNNVFYYA
jgi:hypothetical protein